MTEAHKEVRKKIQSRNKVKEKKSYLKKAEHCAPSESPKHKDNHTLLKHLRILPPSKTSETV